MHGTTNKIKKKQQNVLFGSLFILFNIVGFSKHPVLSTQAVYFEAYKCVLDAITSLAFMDLTLSVV